MSSYVTLLGAEQVQSAARQMQSAADDMKQAARSMDHTFEQQRRFLDDWLMRFADLVNKEEKP